MDQKSRQQQQVSNLNRAVLKLTPIAAGCAVMFALGTGNAYAQDAKPAAQRAIT